MALAANHQPLLTPDDVAALCGVPKATLYVWRSKNRGPRAIRIGKHLRYRQADFDAWLEEQADAI